MLTHDLLSTEQGQKNRNTTVTAHEAHEESVMGEQAKHRDTVLSKIPSLIPSTHRPASGIDSTKVEVSNEPGWAWMHLWVWL